MTTDRPEETDNRAVIRWIFLALGMVAIIALALTTASQPDRPRPTVAVPLDTNSVEPAPLAFQPDIAPEAAETINAERPDYVGPIVAARPFISSRAPERFPDLVRATDCLTQAVYYEAASESPAGQRAVAQVVLNRVRDPRYPSSVCGVVYQGSERRTGCQFTFTCDGALARKPDPFLFARARMVAVAALSGMVEPLVGLATHYHTKQVVPYWRTDLVKLRTVGAHIFYGWQGSPKGLRGLRTGYAGIEPIIASDAITPGLSPDILPTLEATEEAPNPFRLPTPESGLSAPKMTMEDFGQMRADESVGELNVGQSGGLEADNQSGTLARP
jgi:spore germination cell wall hydrolase CwlJ-like protein